MEERKTKRRRFFQDTLLGAIGVLIARRGFQRKPEEPTTIIQPDDTPVIDGFTVIEDTAVASGCTMTFHFHSKYPHL